MEIIGSPTGYMIEHDGQSLFVEEDAVDEFEEEVKDKLDLGDSE